MRMLREWTLDSVIFNFLPQPFIDLEPTFMEIFFATKYLGRSVKVHNSAGAIYPSSVQRREGMHA